MKTPSELAECLLSENRSGRSWRRIAREDYGDRVNFVTLNRIARTGGSWVPKKRKILVVLGLREGRRRLTKHELRHNRAVRKMAKATDEAIRR